jgi:hypothetical protein
VLRTRAPLSPRPKPEFSFDLHVLGPPQTFALSQDQTLQFDAALSTRWWTSVPSLKMGGLGIDPTLPFGESRTFGLRDVTVSRNPTHFIQSTVARFCRLTGASRMPLDG